jgi:hypothetical protein
MSSLLFYNEEINTNKEKFVGVQNFDWYCLWRREMDIKGVKLKKKRTERDALS